ncbi:dynactin subunit 2-like [Metopolophium dirhodum]|uniref:dynactin subunit 2-like n=1 Tax=Metopolophium dirhodum TaxID=44670 RepID=UPI00298F80E3|nr:dynactin subunit 2-like [Metopolophium dirhodum]
MNDSKDVQLNGTSNWKTRPRQIQEKWDTLAIFKDDKLVLMKFNNTEIEDINSNNQTNVCGSYKYFVDSSYVHFSLDILDSFSKSFKIKHKLKSEYWELAAQGEQETPLQKYYRLKFETEDLLIQESNFQIVNESDQNEILCANIGLKIQNILNKLCIYSVNEQLLLESQETTNIFNLQTYITTKLLEKCLSSVDKEQFIVINNISKVLSIGKKFKDLKPNTSKIVQLLQISRLEDRLRKLEVIIGSEKSILMRLVDSNNSDGLVEAVYILRESSKLILPQINVIESRIVNLLPKLKQITSKQLDQNLEVDQKTNKLYEFVLRAREKSNLLSHTIQRMTILDIFRHKVETFAVTMNNLRTQYSETSKTLKKNELLLNNIETYIPKHLANVVSNLQSINAQIEGFAD